MSFTLEKLPDASITLLTLHENFKIPAEMAVSTPQIIELLKTINTPVIHIVDARAVNFTFDEIQLAANLLARGEDPLYHNPQICEVVYVTSHELLIAVFEGMRQQVYGNVSICHFATAEEALAYARAKLS